MGDRDGQARIDNVRRHREAPLIIAQNPCSTNKHNDVKNSFTTKPASAIKNPQSAQPTTPLQQPKKPTHRTSHKPVGVDVPSLKPGKTYQGPKDVVNNRVKTHNSKQYQSDIQAQIQEGVEFYNTTWR